MQKGLIRLSKLFLDFFRYKNSFEISSNGSEVFTQVLFLGG